MEIQHASLAQVRKGRDGRRVLVERDVLDVARQLQEIDPGLRVWWNEYGEYFAVGHVQPDGSESLVTTVAELTPAVVEHVRRLGSAGYDYAAELARKDQQAEKDRADVFTEQVGEAGERLAHAVRNDIQAKPRIFVPGGYGG